MASRKPPKRLFRNKEVIHAYQHDRESKIGMKQMMRDHVDVLQNIEFALVTRARHDSSIDDSILDRALQVSLGRIGIEEDRDPRVGVLCGTLEDFRAMRQDVSEEIWRAALRTMDESVRRHSSLRPGDKSYLEFVGPYVR